MQTAVQFSLDCKRVERRAILCEDRCGGEGAGAVLRRSRHHMCREPTCPFPSCPCPFFQPHAFFSNVQLPVACAAHSRSNVSRRIADLCVRFPPAGCLSDCQLQGSAHGPNSLSPQSYIARTHETQGKRHSPATVAEPHASIRTKAAIQLVILIAAWQRRGWVCQGSST